MLLYFKVIALIENIPATATQENANILSKIHKNARLIVPYERPRTLPSRWKIANRSNAGFWMRVPHRDAVQCQCHSFTESEIRKAAPNKTQNEPHFNGHQLIRAATKSRSVE